MNRKKKVLCMVAALVCFVLAFGVRGEAASQVYSVTTTNQLKSALVNADEGDIILILEEITISAGLTMPDEQVTIKKGATDARLITAQGVEVDFQNIIFDGNGMKCSYAFLTLQGDFTISNCTFQNCGDPENRSGASSIGGAVQVNGGSGSFTNCTFDTNNSTAGGHIAIRTGSTVTIEQCTIKGGYCAGGGGAINVYSGAVCNIESCVITENEAGDFGGGIANGGTVTISNTKLYGNTAVNGGADIGNKEGATINLQDSVERLNELFADDNIIVYGWVCDYDFEEEIYIPDVDPTIENALLKLDYEYQQTEEPDSGETETPEETENQGEETPTEPEEPETPEQSGESGEDNTQTSDETGSGESEDQSGASSETEGSDDGENGDQQQDGESASSTVTDTTTDNSTTTNTETNTTIDNSTDTTSTSSNSSTDNSTSSTDNSRTNTTTDNSRYSSTSDSNNTSTVNNYYTQEAQSSESSDSVQTVVIPVESGEPTTQTIIIERDDADGNGTGEMTLNVNVNVGSEESLSETTEENNGVSGVQVAGLCLLSAILGCVIKRR